MFERSMWNPHSCLTPLGLRKSWVSVLGQMHGHIDMLVATDEYGSTLLHEAPWMQISGCQTDLDTEMFLRGICIISGISHFSVCQVQLFLTGRGVAIEIHGLPFLGPISNFLTKTLSKTLCYNFIYFMIFEY